MFLELNIYYDMKMPYIKANSHILTPLSEGIGQPPTV